MSTPNCAHKFRGPQRADQRLGVQNRLFQQFFYGRSDLAGRVDPELLRQLPGNDPGRRGLLGNLRHDRVPERAGSIRGLLDRRLETGQSVHVRRIRVSDVTVLILRGHHELHRLERRLDRLGVDRRIL